MEKWLQGNLGLAQYSEPCGGAKGWWEAVVVHCSVVRAGEPVQSHGCSSEKSWPRTLGRDSCGDAGGVSTDVLMGSRVQQLCPLSLEKYSFVGLILKVLHGRQVLQAVGKVRVCEGGLSPFALCHLILDDFTHCGAASSHRRLLHLRLPAGLQVRAGCHHSEKGCLVPGQGRRGLIWPLAAVSALSCGNFKG